MVDLFVYRLLPERSVLGPLHGVIDMKGPLHGLDVRKIMNPHDATIVDTVPPTPASFEDEVGSQVWRPALVQLLKMIAEITPEPMKLLAIARERADECISFRDVAHDELARKLLDDLFADASAAIRNAR